MSTLHFTQAFPSGFLLEIAQGDITAEPIDAIVNAANSQLQHGGGVAAAISRRGGPTIRAESEAWLRRNGPLDAAHPAWTHAGDLPCRFVIHAVGPVWGEGEEDAKLAAACRASLDLAAELGCAALALPAISTGIFGFPRPRAARVILATLRTWAVEHPKSPLRRVRVLLWDPPALNDFLEAAGEART